MPKERIKVGNVEIGVARDSDWRFVPTEFIPQVPGEAWKPYLDGADPNLIVESRVLTYIVRSQGKTILVDTGVGEWGLWRFGDGHLLESLKALDVTPESVDFVLPTHLHADHTGWNMRPSERGPVPTFSNARYLFQQADWDHFTSPQFLEAPAANAGPQMIRNSVLPMQHTGLMDLIDSEYKVTDEVTLLHTPGHTPGSVSVLIQSGSEAALLIGDAAHHPAELSETDWSPVPDIDPSLSARSRRAIVAEAKKYNALIGGGHFPEGSPFFGRLIEMDGRQVWRGVDL